MLLRQAKKQVSSIVITEEWEAEMWRHKEMIVEAEGIAANIGAINTENMQ